VSHARIVLIDVSIASPRMLETVSLYGSIGGVDARGGGGAEWGGSSPKLVWQEAKPHSGQSQTNDEPWR
jgi:hypothetical protein